MSALYAEYQVILNEELSKYHAWLDAGGHEVDGNEALLDEVDALTAARVAKFAEWSKLADAA